MKPPKNLHGSATLLALMLLSLSAALLLFMAHHHIRFEHDSSAQQVRSTAAFAAAEAGLDWTLAQLNRSDGVDAQCQAQTGAPRFRQRFGAPSPANTSPRCLLTSASTWDCQCAETPDPPSTALPAPSFQVAIRPNAQPQWLDLTATGCLSTTPDCTAAAQSPRAAVHLTLGYLPALALQPEAALTIRGAADLRAAPWTIVPAQNHLALQAGSSITHGPQTNTRPEHSALHQLPPSTFFTHLFHLPPSAWQHQPVVHTLDCRAPCDTALQALLAGPLQAQMVWLEGGLHLDTPLTLGSPSAPILLVINGPIDTQSPITAYGLLYTRSPEWRTSSSGQTSHIHGAIVFEHNAAPQGPLTLHHDPGLLTHLSQQAGSYAKYPGSWHDFARHE
jgi:hypothetical protein